jgi:hypothetical protein
MHHRAIGKDGDRLAGTRNAGLAKRHRVIAIGHVAGGMLVPGRYGLVVMAVERPVVDALWLEEHDRVIILDRGNQQALRVIGVGRDDGLQTAHMREQRLGALAVRLPAKDAAAIGERSVIGDVKSAAER